MASNAVSSFIMQYQKGTSTGTWITQATLTDSSVRTYTYYGLDPSSQYYFRVIPVNSIGQTPSSAVNTTTLGQQPQTTPSVVSNVNAYRDDSPNASSTRTLALPSVPTTGNSVAIFFNGYSANGGNNSSVTAPSGATLIAGPLYDGTEEVQYVWKMPASSSNSFGPFSNYDTSNNVGWKIQEVSNWVSQEVSHGLASTSTAASIGWPIQSPTFTNAIRLSHISITYASTLGSPSTGVTLLKGDAASVSYHQGVLLSETTSTSSPASLNISGGTSSNPIVNSYVHLNIFGNNVPGQVAGVTPSGVSSKQATISWTSQGATTSAYRLDISTDSGSTWSVVAIIPGSSSSYTVTTLSASTSYQFRVAGYNDSGTSTTYSTVSVTTTTPPSIQVIQSAIGNDNTGSQSVTATLTSPPTTGNLLEICFCGKAGNSLTAPSGSSNSISITNAGGYMLAWTQAVGSSPSSSYTVTGYSDLGSLSVTEIQGVVSVDTATTNTAASYTDGTSGHVNTVTTTGSSTPWLGISHIEMDRAPDSYGTPPSNFTILQKILGNSGTGDIEYHKEVLLTYTSGVAAGTYSIPFVMGNGVVQGASPMTINRNFIGSTQSTAPGTTSITFSTTTSSSIVVVLGQATGTVTGYVIKYSTSSSLSNPTTISTTTLSNTVSGLSANTTYYFQAYAVNGSTQGTATSIVSHATNTGQSQVPVTIGGKLYLINNQIATAPGS